MKCDWFIECFEMTENMKRNKTNNKSNSCRIMGLFSKTVVTQICEYLGKLRYFCSVAGYSVAYSSSRLYHYQSKNFELSPKVE